MLASQGIEPARLGVPRTDGGPVETDSRKIWRTFCENWKLFRGHAVALLAGARAGRGVRGRPGAQRRDGRRHLRPDRRLRGRTRVPSARAARPLQHRGHLHDGRRHLGPAPARPARRRRPGRARAAHLPARRAGLPRPTELARRRRRAGAASPGSTRRVRRLPRRPAYAPRRLRRGRRPGHRPRPPAGRHHADGGRARPGRCTPASSAGRRRARPRSTRSPRTCCSRWRRCRSRTAW